MKKLVLAIILLSLVVGIGLIPLPGIPTVRVNTFDECVAAGNTVMKTWPPQCRAQDGRIFTQDIGNELKANDLIRIGYPRPNQNVSSPLTITGEARRGWYYKATFTISLLDGDGKEIASNYAQAQGDWTIQNFTPFKGTIEFATPTTPKGTLVLHGGSSSVLPVNDGELRVPIIFSR